MQTASTRIWTRSALSISYDDNRYTTDAYIPSYDLFENIKFSYALWHINLCRLFNAKFIFIQISE